MNDYRVISVGLKVSDDENEVLNQLVAKLGITKSDVLRQGLQEMGNKHLIPETNKIEYIISNVVTRILNDRGL